MTNSTELKLINTGAKRVLRPSCTVKMDNNISTFKDFVTVGHNPDTGATTILHNTDAVTLGHSMMMINNAFATLMGDMTQEQQSEVYELLGAK